MIGIGAGYEHLGDEKHRRADGWWTRSNPKYLLGAIKSLGLEEARLDAMKPIPTPGVKRGVLTEKEQEKLSSGNATKYRAAVGSLIYACRNRPDAQYAVKELARAMSSPNAADQLDAIRLVKYLWTTRDFMLESRLSEEYVKMLGPYPENLVKRAKDVTRFKRVPDVEVTVDADWATAKAGYRSTTGCYIHWCGMLLDSISNTQPGVPALSTGESELRALSRGVVEGQHLRHLLEDLGFPDVRIRVKSDATAALSNAAKLGPGRMRHVMVSSVYVKECVRRKQVQLAKVSSEDNIADLNTKYLAKDRFEQLRTKVGVIDGAYAERPRLCSLVKRNVLGDVGVFRKDAQVNAIYDENGVRILRLR